MIEFPILSFLIFLPLVGAIYILFFIKERDSSNAAKNIAMLTSLVTLVISLYMYNFFDISAKDYQFVEKINWFGNYDISYYLGVDGISIYLILLTTLLTPICIIASWNSINKRTKEFMISFLVMETFIIGAFCALDLLLFFIFFEAMLIPMFLIIGIWGGENRVYASIKFFLYTLAGSVFLLLAIIYLYIKTNTLSIPSLIEEVSNFDANTQKILWLAFFASFAIKVPMWPFHTWLPDAHVQAPTSGSVILAGVLLKMGAYGFLRFSLPLFPLASIEFAPYIFILSVIAVIYTSLVALMQEDMKKLIAYSSVAHMGFVTIGIFSFNQQAIEGALIQILSHGLVSGALFLCVGVLYDRMHTKDINSYGGVASKMPLFALIFLFFTLAAIGLPGTSGFIGEFLILLGVFKVSKISSALTATGVILGAAYMLWLYKRVMFGKIKNENIINLNDLSKREILLFVPIILIVLWMGIYPSTFTEYFNLPVENLIKQLSVSSK